MKIILPHKKHSQQVKSWRQIKAAADEMKAMLNANNFNGKWRDGFALSHCQVSETPFNFFVIHENYAEHFSGFDVMCNPRIVAEGDSTAFKEACFSFPFRDVIKTKRSAWVEIEAEVRHPFNILSGLATRTFQLQDLAAFIVQHEIDHAKGVNIYDKFKR